MTIEMHQKQMLAENVELVASAYGITVDDILGRSQRHSYAWARSVLYYLLRRKYALNLTEIGILTQRDHTTVHHGIRRVERRINVDPYERHVVASLMDGQQPDLSGDIAQFAVSELQALRAQCDSLIKRLESRLAVRQFSDGSRDQ